MELPEVIKLVQEVQSKLNTMSNHLLGHIFNYEEHTIDWKVKTNNDEDLKVEMTLKKIPKAEE